MEYTIHTLKGAYTCGSLLGCLEWQATEQGAMADIDGPNGRRYSLQDLPAGVAHANDTYREDGDMTPEEARDWFVSMDKAEAEDVRSGRRAKGNAGMTERKNITQPVDWWAAFTAAAASRGLSLSEWIGEQAKRGLTADARRELSRRPEIGRPRKN